MSYMNYDEPIHSGSLRDEDATADRPKGIPQGELTKALEDYHLAQAKAQAQAAQAQAQAQDQ